MLETALITAVALVFILEGLLPFVFPRLWQSIMTEAAKLSEKELRLMGLFSIAIGMLILLFFTE